MDSVFRRARITASLTKFDYVMEKLPDEILISIKDIVRAINDDTEDPYNLVKDRLLGTYKPSPWALANKLLDYPEIGGGKPSTMMAAMMALLPEGEQPGYLFKSLFLRRLPVELREHLVSDSLTAPRTWQSLLMGCGMPTTPQLRRCQRLAAMTVLLSRSSHPTRGKRRPTAMACASTTMSI